MLLPKSMMNRVVGCVLLFMFAGCAASPAPGRSQPNQDQHRSELPIPTDLQEHIERAEQIGVQLYLLDKAAAIGTDVLRDKLGNLESQGLGGYLPLREGDEQGRDKDSFLVTFFTTGQPAQVAYEIRVFIRPGTQTEYHAFNPPKPASAGLSLLMQARQAAIHALPDILQPLNPVVLAGAAYGENGILVYLLAGTTKPDVAVFGRHYRVLVGEDGTTVKYVRPLSKSILELPTRRPNGEKPEALWVTHLVTDWPLETHVFASLLYKLPVYVGTSRGTWRVNGAKIAFLGSRPLDVQNGA